jgi:hypothetical protein
MINERELIVWAKATAVQGALGISVARKKAARVSRCLASPRCQAPPRMQVTPPA